MNVALLIAWAAAWIGLAYLIHRRTPSLLSSIGGGFVASTLTVALVGVALQGPDPESTRGVREVAIREPAPPEPTLQDRIDAETERHRAAIAAEEAERNRTRFTAAEFYALFERNEIAARERFEDRRVTVSGEIEDVSYNIAGQPVVTLLAGTLEYVSCRFPKEKADALAGLVRGQEVSVSGRARYRIVTVVHMDDCELS